MVTYVLACQIVSVPATQRHHLLNSEKQAGMKLLIAVYSMWNLDFFRSLYKPFCIHPDIPDVHCSNIARSIPTSSEDMEASVQSVYVHQTGVGYTWLASASICYILGFVIRENPLCLL